MSIATVFVFRIDTEVLDVAKRNKSALKANRQNIKRREHNRRCAPSSAPA